MIAHLYQYHVVPGHEEEVLAYLRHGAVPTSFPSSGLVAAYLGRRLGPRGQEHAAATIWSEREAFAEGVDEGGLPRFLSPRAGLIEGGTGETYDIALERRAGGGQTRVLRIARMLVDPGNVTALVERAAASIQTAVGQAGGEAAYLGVAPPDEPAMEPAPRRVAFLTVWASWESLLAATGGRSAWPILDPSEGALGRLVSIDHFEIIGDESGTPTT